MARTPLSYKETFTSLASLKVFPQDFSQEISKSAKLRNLLAHDYDNVDLQEIYYSVKDAIRDYHQYCEYVSKFLEAQK